MIARPLRLVWLSVALLAVPAVGQETTETPSDPPAASEEVERNGDDDVMPRGSGDAPPEGSGPSAASLDAIPETTGFEADPRSIPPPEPTSFAETARRFLPGFVSVGASRELDVPPGSNVTTWFPARAGRCYGAVGWSEEITDLDLAFVWDGETTALDYEWDSYPVVRFCVPSAGELGVRLYALTVGGWARVGLFVDRATEALPRGDDALDVHLLAVTRRAAPRGIPATEVARWTLDGPAIRSLRWQSDRPGCVVAVAAGGAQARDVDIRIRSLDRDLASEDTSPSAWAVASVCVHDRERLELDVALVSGHGPVGAQLLHIRPRGGAVAR